MLYTGDYWSEQSSLLSMHAMGHSSQKSGTTAASCLPNYRYRAAWHYAPGEAALPRSSIMLPVLDSLLLGRPQALQVSSSCPYHD